MKISERTEYVDGRPVRHEDYESGAGSDFSVAVGDVLRLGQALRIVGRASESSAFHHSLTGSSTVVEYEDRRTGEKTRVKRTNWGSGESCASRLPRELLVKRLGPGAFEDFQAAKAGGTSAAWIEQQLGAATTEQKTEMKTTTKKTKKNTQKPTPRGGLYADSLARKAAAPTGGVAGAKTKGKDDENKTHVTGKIFGHPIGGVLRALGKAGVSVEDAAKIIKKQGFKSSPITIKVNVRSGNGTGHNYGPPAPLTDAEIKELKNSI